MRADNVYLRMFSDYVYSKYIASGKSDSFGLLGSIIFSDPWTADYWAELFIVANESSKYENADVCAYSSMVGVIRSYAFTTNDGMLIEFAGQLIKNYHIDSIEYSNWLKCKDNAISKVKLKGEWLLYGKKDWKTEYLSALVMDNSGFVTTNL